MTDHSLSAPIAPVNPLRRMFRDEPVFTGMALLIALAMLPTLGALALDSRPFQGDPVWLKPLKFEFAMFVYLGTLAWFARFLPESMRTRRSYRIYGAIVAFCVLGEILWIGGAAAFATASHFNDTQPVMIALYALMRVFAVTLLSASLVYGIAIWRNSAAELSPPMRLAVALGLIMTFALTLIVAGTLSSGTGHFVGTPTTGATLPIMGWSTEVGDLRVAHLFATHAMHIIPLAALLFATGRAASRWVWLITIGFTLFTFATFVQALAGLPLLALAQ